MLLRHDAFSVPVLDLTGVNAKLDRAYQHLHALDKETRKFVRSYPYGVRQQAENEGRRHISALDIFREPDAPVFGVLIGDCAHNFRSALDHLVHTVAQDSLPETTFRRWEYRLAYPICTTEAAWEDALAGHRLEGSSGAVRAQIERRQPHKTHNPPEHAPLYFLHWINDRDKHRLIHTVAGYVLPAQVVFDPAVPAGTTFNLPGGPYTESGTQILSLDLPEPIPDMQVKFEMMLQIFIRDAPVAEDVRELLLKIGQMIQRIVADVAKAHDS